MWGGQWARQRRVELPHPGAGHVSRAALPTAPPTPATADQQQQEHLQQDVLWSRGSWRPWRPRVYRGSRRPRGPGAAQARPRPRAAAGSLHRALRGATRQEVQVTRTSDTTEGWDTAERVCQAGGGRLGKLSCPAEINSHQAICPSEMIV